MGLRIQLERQKNALFPTMREYSRFFGLDLKRLKMAKEDAIILHPGPVNRGVELASNVVDSDRSFIDEQVTNGVAIRMALLYLLSRRDNIEALN
jgi:aspartate carbamoyltransferase catalytic subunit